MIISQKYHSSTEIDAEFISSLELLMREQTPCFEWIKLKEKSAPENTHFSYFLFFGETCNSPIGYAQLSILNESKKKSLMGMFKKCEKTKTIQWTAPGSTSEGVIFNPAYIKDGMNKINAIFKEYQKREEVVGQSITLSEECTGLVPNAKLTSTEITVDSLIKNRKSYEEYITSLDDASHKEVKSLWKEVYKNQDYRIGEYPSFKECFEYKKNGSKQLKELKKDPSMKDYLQIADTFLTFESPDELFAFVFLFHGRQGQLYFKTFAINEEVKEELLIQTAIMRFYDESDSVKLRFLDSRNYNKKLKSLGFTFKKIFRLELEHD